MGGAMEASEGYLVKNLDKLWIEYDKQNDILYLNFGEDVEEADEEILVDGDVAIRVKERKVVSIMIMNFSEKLGVQFY